MIGDSLGRHGNVLESMHAYEVDRQLCEKYLDEKRREATLEELKATTQITEQEVLNELVDCGLRAESLHVLTLYPMVHVAWANGYVERAERAEILRAAVEDGMSEDSCSYEMLENWLKERPDQTVFKTWKDYVHAVRRVMTKEAFATLRDRTMKQACNVAESAGGCFGYGSVSRAEQAAIDQLRASFMG